MALVTTIKEAKKYLGSIAFSSDDASVPNFARSDRRFIVPIVGDDLYAILAGITVANKYLPLLELYKQAAVPLAYFTEMPLKQSIITERGLQTMDSERMRSAHRWEYEAAKEALEDIGTYALEDLLEYLHKNATLMENWKLPEAYNLTFTTGKEFFKYYPLYQPYRTFVTMRPVIQQVEDQYVKETIGETFFEELRDMVIATTDVNKKPKEKAVDLLKKSVANLTISLSIEMLPVKIGPKGFTVTLSDIAEVVKPGEYQAPNVQLGLLKNRSQQSGESYLAQLKEFLDTNASDSLFATYKASSYFTTAAAREENNAVDINASLKGGFSL
jgi:hypothetical protein